MKVQSSTSHSFAANDEEEEDFDFEEKGPGVSGTGPSEGEYTKKKALQFLDTYLKQWSLDELKQVIKHDSSRTVDIVGFIPQNAINTEFRGQSPQYMVSS